jgi:50S ribosomal protein L16 3-hydroxylase
MKKYWQKKPLLIRQAVAESEKFLSVAEFFRLASLPDIEARLVTRASDDLHDASAWDLKHGPFSEDALPARTQSAWTLLIQDVNHRVPAIDELLSRFRFVPAARLDDAMVSFATQGGGVGPHIDAYDVFLLQLHGHRRWRIGKPLSTKSIPDIPLRILADFEHLEEDQEWLLAPGDMLYIPPNWAHDGVAQDECMTCSIGFRAPSRSEMLADILSRLIDDLPDEDEGEGKDPRYTDSTQTAVSCPARLPAALQTWAMNAVHQLLSDEEMIRLAIGEYLTQPKPKVVFQPQQLTSSLPPGMGLTFAPQTQMIYDDQHIYVNGDSWQMQGRDAVLLKYFADHRVLSSAQIDKASPVVRAWLLQLLDIGWIQLRHSEG